MKSSVLDKTITDTFWNMPTDELMQWLQTTSRGLTSDQVQKRLRQYGANRIKPKSKSNVPELLWGQFKVR
jgi:magnesium-transporting ATPase (P-type)